jgi:TPP-dependent pyruvate/acetoin dehydrogenase alpha subunit
VKDGKQVTEIVGLRGLDRTVHRAVAEVEAAFRSGRRRVYRLVWVRVDGDEVVAVHVSAAGAVEVARHRRGTPGSTR